MPKREKAVLAYSGGLDTSVCVKWLMDKYNLDVITLTIDLGQVPNLPAIRKKALATGAVKAVVVDARDDFVNYFVWPALMAGAMYEGQYPLATALGRPLISKLMVDAARENGASVVAHGCTGKGNDQVRMDVSVHTLAPELKIIAPVREWKWTRKEELAYAAKHGIRVDATKRSPYSTDENLWGRSCEAGVLEDPWVAPRDDAYEWTTDPAKAPNRAQNVEITFEKGRPVAVNGKAMDGVELVNYLHRIAGRHGVGRVDHVENRLVGIKSREIYEAPAAVVLHEAHRALETLTLSKPTLRFKQIVAQEYADVIYNGLWFSAFHQDLLAFVASTQRFVTGTVRVKLFKGACSVTGRRSPHSLYSEALATYDEGDQFDHAAAEGFIRIWGLDQKTQMQLQLGGRTPKLELPRVVPPTKKAKARKRPKR